MRSAIPWSVKGIEPEAREAAKQAARRAGVTLGAWLNQVIMETGTDEVGTSPLSGAAASQPSYQPASRQPTYSQPQPWANPAPVAPSAEVARDIAQRLEQSERRTLELAAQLEQSLGQIASRLAQSERVTKSERMNDLSDNGFGENEYGRLSPARRFEDKPAIQALEKTVGAVVDHLGAADRRTEESLQDIRDKLSQFSRAVERGEKDNRREERQVREAALQSNLGQLAARLEKIEQSFLSFGPHLERAQSQAVEAALKALSEKADAENQKNTLAQVHRQISELTQRLERAEKRNGETLHAFEASVGSIAKRLEDIDTVQKQISSETLRLVNERLDEVTTRLKASDGIAVEIRQAIQDAMASVSVQVDNSERNGKHNVDALHTAMAKLSERLIRVERNAKNAATMTPMGTPQFGPQFAPIPEFDDGFVPTQAGFPIPNFDAPPMGISRGISGAMGAGMPGNVATSTTFDALAYRGASEDAAVSATAASAAAHVADEGFFDVAPPPPQVTGVVPRLGTRADEYDEFESEGAPASSLAADISQITAPAQVNAAAAQDFLAAARRAAQAAALGGGSNVTYSGAISRQPYATEHKPEESSSRKLFKIAGAALFLIAAILGGLWFLNGGMGSNLAAPIESAAHDQSAGPASTPGNAPITPMQSDLSHPTATSEDTEAATTAPEAATASAAPTTSPFIMAPQSMVPAVNTATPAPSAAAAKKTVARKTHGKLIGLGTLTPGPKLTPAPSTPVISAPAGADAAVDTDNTTPTVSALINVAQSGDAGAQYDLGQHYAAGDGVSQNLNEAARWYEKAAKQGVAVAQYRLATLYEKGHGTAQSDVQARIWYEKAATQGNVKAMHNLAVIYAEGRGTKQDFTTAARWFTQAANYGLGDSQYNLAILNERGLGMPQDLATAYKWLAIAAKGGDKGAAGRLDEIAAKLDAVTLAQAKLSAESWIAQTPDAAVNSDVGPGAASENSSRQ